MAGPTTMEFPLLRVLSCCLIPQGWLPGESPVLAPLSPDGWRRWFTIASLLEYVVLVSPSRSLSIDWCKHTLGVGFVLVVRVFFWAISSMFLCWSSGSRSSLAAAGPVLAFSRSCVLELSVCGWWYIFPFSWLRPFRVVIL
ncbi:Os04g0429450 [Oryza sativa Japonica Group]|uniref:Os04g0429450 protein n=2 Tax=Oryza sativa TaxID=4530 RepID=A0A0P0WAB2_ORYSJ|nr:hypothetical protein OsI_15922 [Oryza sativa Indica Group]BAS89243.1 Os04g0429450 [Oryza sativa Japonica Group]